MADKPSRELSYVDGINDEYRYEVADANARANLANKLDKAWDSSKSGSMLTVASGGVTTPVQMALAVDSGSLKLRSATAYSDGTHDEYATIPLANIRVPVDNTLGSTSTTNALSAAKGKELSDTKLSKMDVLNLFYPVGTIYQTTDSTFDPEDKWGGTWESIKGRFLLSDSNDYTVGNTGGESTHKLTVQELPSHTHTMYVNNDGSSSSWSPVSGTYLVKPDCVTTSTKNYGGKLAQNGAGLDQAHNNMPPYLVVRTWKRVK